MSTFGSKTFDSGTFDNPARVDVAALVPGSAAVTAVLIRRPGLRATVNASSATAPALLARRRTNNSAVVGTSNTTSSVTIVIGFVPGVVRGVTTIGGRQAQDFVLDVRSDGASSAAVSVARRAALSSVVPARATASGRIDRRRPMLAAVIGRAVSSIDTTPGFLRVAVTGRAVANVTGFGISRVIIAGRAATGVITLRRARGVIGRSTGVSTARTTATSMGVVINGRATMRAAGTHFLTSTVAARAVTSAIAGLERLNAAVQARAAIAAVARKTNGLRANNAGFIPPAVGFALVGRAVVTAAAQRIRFLRVTVSGVAATNIRLDRILGLDLGAIRAVRGESFGQGQAAADLEIQNRIDLRSDIVAFAVVTPQVLRPRSVEGLVDGAGLVDVDTVGRNRSLQAVADGSAIALADTPVIKRTFGVLWPRTRTPSGL